MPGLITDLEDVFRPSLPLALTPTAHSVPTVASSSPTGDRTKPFSAHQFAERVQGAQQLPGLDTGLLQSQTAQSREETAEEMGREKKPKQTPYKKPTHNKNQTNQPKRDTKPFPLPLEKDKSWQSDQATEGWSQDSLS